MVAGRLATLAVLTCAGCDVVFGLGTGSAPDAAIDAGPQVVTGVIARNYIHNDADGLPIAEAAPHAASPIDAYVIGEPTALPVTWDPATQQFTFPVAGRYRVLQQMRGGVREIQGSAAQLAIDETLLGHPDDAPPPTGVTLTYRLTPAPLGGDAERVATTGVWSSSVPSAQADGSLRLGWESLTRFPGQQPATVRPGAHDRVVFFRARARPASAGVDDAHLAIVATSIKPLDGSVSLGTVAPIDVALVDVARDRCQYIDAPIGRALTRLTGALDGPPGWTAGSSAWVLYALTLPALGFNAQISLAQRTLTADLPPHTIMYGEAFPGSTPVMVVSANVRRQPAAGPAANAYLQLFTPGDPSCAATASPIDDAPIPYALELGGTELDTDGLNVAVPDGGIELTWRLDEPGTPATVHVVSLSKVTSAGRVAVRAIWSAEPRVWIDPTLLEDGQSYGFTIQSMTWFPGAASGDFATRAATWARGYLDSPTFTAQR